MMAIGGAGPLPDVTAATTCGEGVGTGGVLPATGATFGVPPALGEGVARLQVLARQPIDPAAPPHPFVQSGRNSFDALLQSAPDTFAGRLLVCDTTMFSSTAGGVDSLRRLWRNIVQRPRR